MNYSDASEFSNKIKNYHKDIDDNFETPPIILPELRSYKRKAVEWMVEREQHNDMTKSDGSPFCGGILADEMGLGKTVEILSCITSNTAPLEFYKKQVTVKDFQNNIENKPKTVLLPSMSKYAKDFNTFNLKKTPSKTRHVFKNWYSSVDKINAVSKKTDKRILGKYPNILECYCVKTPLESTLVVCAICGKGQHAQCVNFMPKPLQEVPYLCADCWYINDKLQCKATLIVVPLYILSQWLKKIKEHTALNGLKVFVYHGLHATGYIQPIDFNDYDIVITTYSNLSKDLKFFGKSSPLPCIKWWRICFDEVKSVKSGTIVSKLSSCLQSVNIWAITSTPIQKSLNDLYGIFKFLGLSSCCNRNQFLQLMNGRNDNMYNVFSNLVWRNSVEDINSELCIPKLTTEHHLLTFSPIEKLFYHRQHHDCASLFSTLSTRLFPSLDISVKNIDRKKILSVIKPLFKLQQVCVHPQAVNGNFLEIKETMTMEKLIDVKIEKGHSECNAILRTLIYYDIAIAELYLIDSKIDSAIEQYRTVISLMEKYKDKKLKINLVLKIKVLYNLSTIINENDSNLKNDIEQLEEEYLSVFKQNVEITRKIVTHNSVKLDEYFKNNTLKFSQWWSDMLDWILPADDFLSELQKELEDYRVPDEPNIANKLKSMVDVHNILGRWLVDLDLARNNTIPLLKTLNEAPMTELIASALSCCLGLKSNNSKNQCFSCVAKVQLKVYKSLLFSVPKRLKSMSTDTDKENDEDIIQCIHMCDKMSQKEFLLMKLFHYIQAKTMNNMSDAAELMEVLKLLRIEFRHLQMLWFNIKINFHAHYTINLAKSKFNFFDNEKSEADEGPPKKKARKNDEKKIFTVKNKDVCLKAVLQYIPLTEAKLENAIGTLTYLENLKKEKENSSEMEPCSICCLSNDCGWAVLQCGHSVCGQCLTAMYNPSDEFGIACPMCRNHTPIECVSYVKTLREGETSGITIKGSFSTKIDSVVLKLMELIAEDPMVKVLIYSNWEKTLELLGKALEHNSINHRKLKNGNKSNKNLEDFKMNENINVLLMKLSSDSKGLNLTEASRVFFIEPIINKADELQAIQRVHRVGQTKPTFVHHFIIQDSIEENITKIFSRDQIKDKWDDITLSELIKVFERN